MIPLCQMLILLYLGIKFNFNNNFKVCVEYLCSQASRAMYALINKSKKLGLPIDIQLDLFNATVIPILTYGIEVWGYSHLDIIEKLYIKFFKYLLCVNKKTASVMIYGELGVYPSHIIAFSRIISYWARLINSPSEKYQ